MKRSIRMLMVALLTLAFVSSRPISEIHADSALAHLVAPACAYSDITASVLQQTTQETFGSWISKLSGAEPVNVGGQPVQFTTRFSPALFDGSSKAFDYLEEQVLALYPASQVEVDEYPTSSYDSNWSGRIWKNLILTIPGKAHPEQVVIMSAHFDSTSGYKPGEPYFVAPGADDNASGSASLLEAARLLHDLSFDRTIKLIWFTGEEQGLWGSSSYADDHDLSGVVGVVNLDMFANDSDGDNCFEIHVSSYPSDFAAQASNAVGQCMVSAIKNYGLDSLKYDYITKGGTYSSDHASFWKYGVGAIEAGENFFAYNNTPGGCTGADESPYYHQPGDTIDHINLPFALSIHKAALATVIDIANASSLFLYIPLLMSNYK